MCITLMNIVYVFVWLFLFVFGCLVVVCVVVVVVGFLFGVNYCRDNACSEGRARNPHRGSTTTAAF